MWWHRHDDLAVLRAEIQTLVTRISGTVNDIHEQLIRIDKQVATLAATAGFRWTEGWVAAEAAGAAPEGVPAPLRPPMGRSGPASGFVGHYL